MIRVKTHGIPFHFLRLLTVLQISLIVNFLWSNDVAPVIELNASFDHMTVGNEHLQVSYDYEGFSIDFKDRIEFKSGIWWDDLQPDYNNYESVVKLTFTNASKYESDWWLNLPGNKITAFVFSNDLQVAKYHTGNLVSRNKRPIHSHFKINSFVPLHLASGDTLTVIAKIQQTKFYPLNRRMIHIARPGVAELQANEFSTNYRYSLGFYTAAILLLGIYVFIYFLFSRERYALYLTLVCVLYTLLFQGYHSGFYRWNFNPTGILYGAFVLSSILVALDMFFLSAFSKKELALIRWSTLFNRLGLISCALVILCPLIYYFSQDFFLVLLIIAIVHGTINLIRLVFGSYLIRMKEKLHVLIGVTLLVSMIVNFISSYYLGTADFRSYDLQKLVASFYALGFVISLSYISVKSRKERVIAESQRIASELRITELEHLDQLKSKLFTNIAHEFRTPLSLISGPIQTILNKNLLTERDSKLLRTSKSSATELVQKINAILDLSKLENSSIKLYPMEINVFESFVKWLSYFEEIANVGSIDIILDFWGSELDVVLVDHNKLETIVKNLISNAIKAMPNGGHLHAKVRLSESQLNIKIEDSGHGIEGHELDLIFDRYYRSDTEYMKNVVGTGIGLSLCKEYTELLGGRIAVQSKLNQGTVFSLTIPIIYSHSKNSNNSKDSSSSVSITAGSAMEPKPELYFGDKIQMPTILIVEDNHHFRFYLRSILEEQFRIVEARNGKEAIEYLRSIQENNASKNVSSVEIDLIITDLMMPFADGFQLIDKIKADVSLCTIPIIITSAKSNEDSKDSAIRFGVDDYLVKPFEEQELLSRINILTKRTSLRIASRDQYSSLIATTYGDDLIDKFRIIVEENISELDITLEDFASMIYVSKRILHRRVKVATGMTPNQMVQEIRLEKARGLLMNGTYKSVKQVALNVGFKRSSYFSKVYFERFGRRPSSYFIKV